jgi:hypothetical protein
MQQNKNSSDVQGLVDSPVLEPVVVAPVLVPEELVV